MQDQRKWLETMTDYYIINNKEVLMIDHYTLIKDGTPR